MERQTLNMIKKGAVLIIIFCIMTITSIAVHADDDTSDIGAIDISTSTSAGTSSPYTPYVPPPADNPVSTPAPTAIPTKPPLSTIYNINDKNSVSGSKEGKIICGNLYT